MKRECGLVVALDTSDLRQALSLVRALAPEVRLFKVGMELFYAGGRAMIDEIAGLGAKVFCDLKLHDIPATVRKAASVLTRPGVAIIDVHAAGGARMMMEAVAGVRAAADSQGIDAPMVVGVTLLTSIDREVFARELGMGDDLSGHVVRMAQLARAAGLCGVVTSAFEVAAIRDACGQEFVTVVPGVRPRWAQAPDDQRRCVSPREAVLAGADYVVVGRPIARAPRPVDAVRALLDEMEEAAEASV